MRRILIPFALVVAMVACADDPAGPGSGGSGTPEPSPTESPSPMDTLRVDLVEAGLRAVLPSDGDVLYLKTGLCRSTMMNEDEECLGRLSGDEQAILAERLHGMAGDVRFIASYDEIPEGQAPIDGASAVVAWVGPPDEQPNGSYWIEAGETCGGLCGHGGIYVLEPRGDHWVSTGPAPGTGQWIS
jgi:hypothetical protein